MQNTWPGGYMHAMDQEEHARWNAANYPGTRELCVLCDAPTGRAGRGEDSIFREMLKTEDIAFNSGVSVCDCVGDVVGPLCPQCCVDMVSLGMIDGDA